MTDTEKLTLQIEACKLVQSETIIALLAYDMSGDEKAELATKASDALSLLTYKITAALR